MKKWSSKTVQSLVLAVEAALVILGLATTGKAAIGMACYWAVVAVDHLTDFIFHWREDQGTP